MFTFEKKILVRHKTFPFLKLVLKLYFLLFSFTIYAQTIEQSKQITKSYDLKKIEQLKVKYAAAFKTAKQKAIRAAQKNGWDIYKKNDDGSFDELMFLDNDGNPVYFSINNKDAAKSTRASFLHTGGGMGLTLDGQNMRSCVWDGGAVRTTHQEFGGRVTIGDGNTTNNSNSFHATHVTGTISATGIVAQSKGMAPLSTVKTFDWNDDTTEALAEAQNGLLLSNHSYGIPLTSSSNWSIGAYTDVARQWDELLYSVPYYLMVAAAGNDGNTTNPAPSTNGYDKLTGNKTAKNNLVVANANDANIDNNGNLVSVTINSSSSQGPTDDNRIKPDITGNGTQLYSTIDTSDTSYENLTGTSMASPNVMGTLLLLQQHYNNINNRFMKAATLKGLACHTADDVGKTGPDQIYGWGLLNAKKAALAITNNGLQSWISEETLQQGQTFSFTVTSDGVNPLLASICWTDLPGTAISGVLNGTTPALVNDLDIRVTKNTTTYYPWKLQSNAVLSATTGDNSVDNVERINVNNATGTYTITVTNKGTLQSGSQNFAFIVTGITSAFSLTSLSTDQSACQTGTAAYNFNYTATNSTATSFSVTGLPTGATATFSSNSLNASAPFTMTIGNLQGATPGNYTIAITGNNGLETETRYVNLVIIDPVFLNTTLTYPANAQTGVSLSSQLTWTAINNADHYHVQVATDMAFSNIIFNANTTTTAYTVNNLNENTTYYWRVFPANQCTESTTSDVFNFQTGLLVCNNLFVATDYTNATIYPSGTLIASAPVTVTGGIIIGNVKVNVNISHTHIQDLTLILEGPAELGFPSITILDEACGNNQDIDCTFSDSGSAIVCNPSSPGISGFVIPYEALSSFNNQVADGQWTLYAKDFHNLNGGAINSFSLDFCSIVSSLSVKSENTTTFSVVPNPTKGIVNITITNGETSKTVLHLFDIQGRSILTKETSSSLENLNIENLQNGVYFLSIENGNQKTTKKIILNK